MNDMRLPGVGPFSAEALTSANNDGARDPAQDFDAVMSRFGSDRHPASTPAAKDRARDPQEAKGARGSNAERARKADKAEQDAADGATPQARPVARSKPDASDEDSAAAGPDAGGKAAAATADAAMLASLAAAAAGTSAVGTPQDAETKPTDAAATPGAKDVKSATGEWTLDVLANPANAGASRSADTPTGDRRFAADEDGATPGPLPRRAQAAAKDTLRIDAPLMRTLDAAHAEAAARTMIGTNPLSRDGKSLAASSQEAAPQALTAAIGANAHTPAATATYSIAHAAIGAPVTSRAFADELSQRVVLFAGQKVQRADIAVTPADLGPIAVSIEVRGQEATLAFTAASHTTRAAIEDALPRLRDMLSAQGLHLAGTHVGSEPRRDAYRPPQGNASGTGSRRANDGLGGVASVDVPGIRRRRSLIDIEV